MVSLIWATRGRAWGFRFLLDGGLADPLPEYERAFAGAEGETTICRRVRVGVAVRFPDPAGRRDEAGRVIPHDLVVPSPLADGISSSAEGQELVWPLLAEAFADLWAQPHPPSPADVEKAMGQGLPRTGHEATKDGPG